MSRNRPRESTTYFGSIEENLYYILKDRGKELLNDFIIAKLKLKKLKTVKDIGVIYIPQEMEKNLIYPNPVLKLNKSILDFIRDYKDEIVNSLDADWVEIFTGLSDKFGKIHIDFKVYFMRKFDYLRRNSLFQYNLKIVKDLIDHLYRSAPAGWKKEWGDKIAEERIKEREKSAKEKEAGKRESPTKIKFYSLNNPEVLEKGYVPIKFKLLFNVLKDYKESAISFSEINQIEKKMFDEHLEYLQTLLDKETDLKERKDLEKQIEEAKSKIDKYQRQKYRIRVENHRKSMQSIFTKIENIAIRMNKRFLKMLYDYHTASFRGYDHKKSPFR